MTIRGAHEVQLEESGITRQDWLGISSVKDGLEFKYFNPSTKKFSNFYRVRLDKEKDKQKYTQPQGSGCRLYFPPTYAASPDSQQQRRYYDAIFDTESKPREIFIVEGEKKALALQERLGPRVTVIGLGGVQNWGKKDDDGDRSLVKDFEIVKGWKDRRVYICFDSDVESNPQVERAEFQLQQALKDELGARARLMTIPPMEDGDKAGIDDLIVGLGDNFEREWVRLKRDAISGLRFRIPEPISGKELCDTEWKFEAPILGNGKDVHLLVEGGTGFVHAGSGVGKTYFMLQLAAAIACGGTFLGFKTRRSRVLFLQQELSEGWFARRVRRLRSAFGLSVNELKFINGNFPIASQDRFKNAHLHLDRLERLIIRNDAQFVVLDPLQGFYNLSEGSVDHAREFMKAVTSAAKKTGACIIMSHHDRKDQSGPGISQMRGGSPFSDLADTVMGIKRAPEVGANGKIRLDEYREPCYHPTDLILRFDKVRHSEGPLPSQMYLTRKEDFPDGSRNPFFEVASGGFDYAGPDFSGPDDSTDFNDEPDSDGLRDGDDGRLSSERSDKKSAKRNRKAKKEN